jgi:hypothetical protein
LERWARPSQKNQEEHRKWVQQEIKRRMHFINVKSIFEKMLEKASEGMADVYRDNLDVALAPVLKKKAKCADAGAELIEIKAALADSLKSLN